MFSGLSIRNPNRAKRVASMQATSATVPAGAASPTLSELEANLASPTGSPIGSPVLATSSTAAAAAATAPATPAASGNAFITSKFQPMNIPIPFLQSMDTDAKAFFKPKLNAINGKKVELAQLAKKIQASHEPLNAALKNKGAIGALNIRNKSFRGKNAPQVYVAEDGGNYIVRGNFMEQGYPFRVTNANSFNAVLAAMKAKRGNVKGKLNTLRKAVNVTEAMEKEYGVKQTELAKLIKTLQKEHQDYLSKRAKNARAMTRTIVPSAAPSAMSTTARQALEAPKAPGFLGKLFGKGGTRKNRKNRKTRKNRRNTRR